MRLVATLALPALLLACPTEPPSTPMDAGSPPAADAGGAADAGTTPTDAGPAPSHALIGTWRVEPPEDGFDHVGFREDNMLVMLAGVDPCYPAGPGFPYSYENDVLTVSPEGEPNRVPTRWDGDDLILTIDDEDVRLIRTDAQCHGVPEPIDLVGTWDVVDGGEDGISIAFADNGYMFMLVDADSCQVGEIHSYRVENDRLYIGTSEEPMPLIQIGDNILLGDEVQLRPRDSSCHEQMSGPTDIPESLIGTYQATPADDIGIIALREDNTVVGISDTVGCVEAWAYPVDIFGQLMVIHVEDDESTTVGWQLDGTNVLLTSEDGDLITLSRIRSDCHSTP